MRRRPPRSTRTYTLLPYTTRFRSHVRAVGPRLQDGLRRSAGHPLVGEVRGIGLIAAVELVADKATKAPFDPLGKVGAFFAARAQDHGVIFRNLGDTIACCPPMIISEREIDEILAAFGKALRSEEHTSELQSLMRISYAVFCLK